MPIPYPPIEADSRILFAAGYEASKPQFKGGGVAAPRLYGSRPNSPILVLEYRYLGEADTFSILTAWNNSLSGFFELTLPSEVACGITNTDLAERIVSASSQGWRFAEKPRIENLPAKRHNVTVRLEGGFYAVKDFDAEVPPVPPANTIDIATIVYTQSSTWYANAAATNAGMTNGVTAETLQTGTDATGSLQWVQMDLGSVCAVKTVYVGSDFTEALAGGWGKSYTENRDMQYSLDGSTWTTFTNTGTFSTPLKTFSVLFDARYIRIVYSGFIAVTEFYATSA